jgi:hypothetical protein
MVNKDIGGGDCAYAAATGAGQRGIWKHNGLNNIGLLVKTCGTVTAAGYNWFYVDDGSAVEDGSGATGIYVETGEQVVPTVGSFVSLAGISSCDQYNGKIVNTLLLVGAVSGLDEFVPEHVGPVNAQAQNDVAGDAGVLITWDKGTFPDADPSVTYNIYRDSTTVKLATIPAFTGIRSYMDTTAVIGQHHQYYVSATCLYRSRITETQLEPAPGLATPLAGLSLYDLMTPYRGSQPASLQKVTFQWFSQEGADTYVIQISTNPTFSNPEYVSSEVKSSPSPAGQTVTLTVTDTLFTKFGTLLPKTPIFWRVGQNASIDNPGPVGGYIWSENGMFLTPG